MAFYVKLGALLVKQVSKPLASQLKSTAVAHPRFRVLLTRLGQRLHEANAALTQSLKSDGELATGRKARARARLRQRARATPDCGVMNAAVRAHAAAGCAPQVFITKLDEDTALKKAADLLGEVFIFAVRPLPCSARRARGRPPAPSSRCGRTARQAARAHTRAPADH
jgi:hypothetical protein